MTWDKESYTWYHGGPVEDRHPFPERIVAPADDPPAVECGHPGWLYPVPGTSVVIARCAGHAPAGRAFARPRPAPCDALTWPEPAFELTRVVGLTAAELERLAPDGAGPGMCGTCRLMPAEPGRWKCADCAELAALEAKAGFAGCRDHRSGRGCTVCGNYAPASVPPARPTLLPPRPVLLLAAAMVLFVLSLHVAAWLVLPAACCMGLAVEGAGRPR